MMEAFCEQEGIAYDICGGLFDDFAFLESARTLHVINAPSPAATASLAIGQHIVGMRT